jgi:aspartokinase/homoserine dehydrogenase 1
MTSLSPAPVPDARHATPLDVFVAGVGHVGGALIDQIGALPPPSADRPPLRLIGACTTRGGVFAHHGVDADGLRSALADAPAPDWPRLLDQIVAHAQARPTVFVDATGHPAVADHVEPLLAAGVSVATPSKLAPTRSQAAFERLRALGDGGLAHFRYEATVGAGLPVIGTLRDLVATGDRVLSIRGVFSGTMTYLFSQLERGVAFGEAVRRAYEQGYTEPDPRDDLGGEDVVRKLIILARTAGLRVERSEVEVESLVPAGAAGLPLTLVTDAFGADDGGWAARVGAAARDGQRLRYVGRVEPGADGRGRLRVGVEAVAAESPLGRLGGTDNLIEITTARYAHAPLVIQGPGAGPAVTAGGVLADVLAVARAHSR